MPFPFDVINKDIISAFFPDLSIRYSLKLTQPFKKNLWLFMSTLNFDTLDIWSKYIDYYNQKQRQAYFIYWHTHHNDCDWFMTTLI